LYQCFRGPCCLHHQGIAQTTRCYNPEDSHLQEASLVVNAGLDFLRLELRSRGSFSSVVDEISYEHTVRCRCVSPTK
jgi:hypothetical protein